MAFWNNEKILRQALADKDYVIRSMQKTIDIMQATKLKPFTTKRRKRATGPVLGNPIRKQLREARLRIETLENRRDHLLNHADEQADEIKGLKRRCDHLSRCNVSRQDLINELQGTTHVPHDQLLRDIEQLESIIGDLRKDRFAANKYFANIANNAITGRLLTQAQDPIRRNT